jgi:uncharacterized coiled-coil protein SlyX
LSCLVSFNLLLEKFDAKIASKDDIIASMNEELLSKNIMVDSMTQEIEKLVDELASTNNKLLASNGCSGSISTTELRRILTNFGEKLTTEFNEIWSD